MNLYQAVFYPSEEIVIFSSAHLAEAEMKASLMPEKVSGFPVVVTKYD